MELPQLIREQPYEIPPPPERMVWTSSSIRLFRRCPRKWFWKYYMRLRPRVRATSLVIGGAFHEALAEWYASKKKMSSIARRHVTQVWDEAQRDRDLYDGDEFDKLSYSASTLTGMLEGYASTYAADRQRWPIEKDLIEVEFMIDLGEFDFAGKIDLVCRKTKRSNRYRVIEHKTASKITDSYIKRLPLDTQVRAYLFGAKYGLELDIEEVVYDVVRKCSLRKKANETPEEFNARITEDYEARPDFYFFREPLKFASADVDAFEFELEQTHAMYQHIINSGDPQDPRTWGIDDSECNAYFRMCPYHELCTTGLDHGTAIMYEQYEDMHEELEFAEE
jgi:hypothetical protein